MQTTTKGEILYWLVTTRRRRRWDLEFRILGFIFKNWLTIFSTEHFGPKKVQITYLELIMPNTHRINHTTSNYTTQEICMVRQLPTSTGLWAFCSISLCWEPWEKELSPLSLKSLGLPIISIYNLYFLGLQESSASKNKIPWCSTWSLANPMNQFGQTRIQDINLTPLCHSLYIFLFINLFNQSLSLIIS